MLCLKFQITVNISSNLNLVRLKNATVSAFEISVGLRGPDRRLVAKSKFCKMVLSDSGHWAILYRK
jgi:hypothetical protein